MNKFDEINARFIESMERPAMRKAELLGNVETLRNQEATAKKAFTDAENDGIDSTVLFNTWDTVKKELHLMEARYNALDESKCGKDIPKLATDLEQAGHKEVDEIQLEKQKLIDKLKDFTDKYLEVAYQINELQARQGNIKAKVGIARKVCSTIEPISENCLLSAEQFPYPTVAKVRGYIYQTRQGG